MAISDKSACDNPQDLKGDEFFDELATLCEIERVLRDYLTNYYEPHSARHDRPFAPGTMRMADAIKPLLEHLDDGRASVGAIGASDEGGHKRL